VKAGTAGIVRQYLSIAGSMPPDQVSMAKLMNTSERTFKRRLSEEGTSFRSLLMEVRYAMAKELLEIDDHPIWNPRFPSEQSSKQQSQN